MASFPDDGDAQALAELLDGPEQADHESDRDWAHLGLLVGHLLRQAESIGGPSPTHRAVEVFNYWDEATPPADVAACLASWAGSGLPVRTYDRDSADEYLRHHYGGDVLAAFRYCHHPSMQSDILRMARLLQDGGLYVDADDAWLPGSAVGAFAAGTSLIALAVCRHCPASLQARADDPVADHAWYYFGSAPWFSEPGHPLVARSLERAVAAMTGRRRRGELASIHADVGPGCVSMAALDHARACLRAGEPIDTALSTGWPFLEQSRMLGYKATDRNWRRNVAIYPPDRTDGAVV